MEYTLKNQSKDDQTEVIITGDFSAKLSAIAAGYTKTVFIADENSAEHCLDDVRKALGDKPDSIVLPAGEDNKSLEFVETILGKLREVGFDRSSLLIGLGGGVVSDIVGFAASTYMRGIDWVMLPTTLIAQADASIGGKTGVNLGGYKNMVGSFWPPKAVLINPGFLKTLPVRELRNGLAEIIKMGFISDKAILGHVAKIDPDNILGTELDKAAGLAVKAKIEIVNADMYESGERKLLNFGHTVGHAFESASMGSSEPLLHGEAVAIGMVAETKLAELEGVCEPGLADAVKETLERFGLPIAYKSSELDDILERIGSDKKNVGDRIYWTMPKTAGQGIYNHIADEANIRTAINAVIN